MCYIVPDFYPVLTEKRNSFGEYLPFSLFHYSALEYLGCVAFLDVYGFLQYNRSAVAFCSHKMHRGTRDLDASSEHFFMYMKTVISLSAERGDQCRVNIDDLIRIRFHEAHRDLHHKARQYDQIREAKEEAMQMEFRPYNDEDPLAYLDNDFELNEDDLENADEQEDAGDSDPDGETADGIHELADDELPDATD